jgi:hypothetical protein
MLQGKKKLYVLVMILGGIALFVDRVFLSSSSEPEVAEAATTATADDKPASVKAVSPTPQASPIPELNFPRQLPAYDVSTLLRDWFEAPKLPGIEQPPEGTPDNGSPLDLRAAVALVSAKEAFVANHRLDGIVINDNWQIAIVDSVWLRVGQAMDDCMLSEVSGRTAVFACEDGDAQLTLFQDMLATQP